MWNVDNEQAVEMLLLREMQKISQTDLNVKEAVLQEKEENGK